jgi:hypothetical protein
MKYAGIKMLFVIFSILLAVSCRNNPSKETASVATRQTPLPNPPSPKEILINDDRYDKPYTILGPIEYTLKRNTSTFVNQIELRNQAIDFLKQNALARYGNKVDAIMKVNVQEIIQKSYVNPLSITHIQGIAISFKPEYSPKHKTKHKAKSSKNKFSKAKWIKGTSRKTKSDKIKITPSELLK